MVVDQDGNLCGYPGVARWIEGDMVVCATCGQRTLTGEDATIQPLEPYSTPEHRIMAALTEPRTVDEIAHDLQMNYAFVESTLKTFDAIGLAASNEEWPSGVWRLTDNLVFQDPAGAKQRCHIELVDHEEGVEFNMTFSPTPPDTESKVYGIGMKIMDDLSPEDDD